MSASAARDGPGAAVPGHPCWRGLREGRRGRYRLRRGNRCRRGLGGAGRSGLGARGRFRSSSALGSQRDEDRGRSHRDDPDHHSHLGRDLLPAPGGRPGDGALADDDDGILRPERRDVRTALGDRDRESIPRGLLRLRRLRRARRRSSFEPQLHLRVRHLAQVRRRAFDRSGGNANGGTAKGEDDEDSDRDAHDDLVTPRGERAVTSS